MLIANIRRESNNTHRGMVQLHISKKGVRSYRQKLKTSLMNPKCPDPMLSYSPTNAINAHIQTD